MLSKLPNHAVKRLSAAELSDGKDGSFKKLVGHYCKYLKGEGIPVAFAIIGSQAYRQGVGHVTGSATKGISDTWITFNGRSICIELKIGRDKQRDKQKVFQKNQEEANGEYHIVKDWDDLFILMEDLKSRLL